MDDKGWTDTRTPMTPCPLCGYRLDAALGKGQATTSPGDLSVCIGCASPLVFNDDLTLRLLRSEEFDNLALPEKNELRRYMAAARRLDRRGRR